MNSLALQKKSKREKTLDDSLHRKQDRQSYLIHEEAFNDVERREEILSKAKSVVARWIAMHSTEDSKPSPYWVSWEQKMTAMDFDGLKKFALSSSDESIAHRQSSPFSTCLTAEQKAKVKDKIRNEFRKS